ncbi:heavy-metal-associated domain-containing protein [Clostridium oceanicum]|uniref:Heavy-metal-associated domain-containing protein n=1 Tax=Clostridium oceanicum TaxID=1543 RepID=A0ABP3UWX3_9CLOT
MKAVLKVCDMKTSKDINKVKNALANNQGIVACEINKDKREVNIIYDNYFLNVDKIIESIEDTGYIVI